MVDPVQLFNLVTTTPSRFTVIRPDLLPPMAVLQSISTEDMISNRMARFKALWHQYDPPMAAEYDVGNLEFDPIRINQECNSFFEALVRDRVNQACRAITLAFAIGSDLDAIGSRYPYGVPRLQYDAAGNVLTQDQIEAGAIPASSETDVAYRMRLWLSPSILSLNGPGQGTYESYVFWALSAPMPAGAKPLRHASIYTTPGTGNVYIVIMSDDYQPVTTTDVVTGDLVTIDQGSGPTPSAAQIKAVYDYINDKDFARKGLTDVISVLRPQVTHIKIQVQIQSFPGVDSKTLMTQVNAAVNAVVANIRWLGADLTRVLLAGAIGQSGTYNGKILAPVDEGGKPMDVVVNQAGVIQVDEIRLSYIGVGE